LKCIQENKNEILMFSFFLQWRDFAKEVDGLLRIGAVNCGDDRMLCRMKGVNSYPSLFIFRSGMVRDKLAFYKKY
jgi:hypothetical protein